jgi:hypothetical protein
MQEEQDGLKEFVTEMEAIGREPPATFVVPKKVIFSLISTIQLATHHPMAVMGSPLVREAIAQAKLWQKLIFSEHPVACKLLEDGWDSEQIDSCQRPDKEAIEASGVDLEKYVAEIAQVAQENKFLTFRVAGLAAVAAIVHIQLASRHPDAENFGDFSKIAIDLAKELQQCFQPETEIYKVLELGWDPDCDLPQEDLFGLETIDDYAGEDVQDRYIDPEEFNNVDPPRYW